MASVDLGLGEERWLVDPELGSQACVISRFVCSPGLRRCKEYGVGMDPSEMVECCCNDEQDVERTAARLGSATK